MTFDLSTAKPVGEDPPKFDITTAKPVGEDIKVFKREVGQQILEALPTVGSIGGGMLGFAGGGPAGSLVGTVAGASIGTSAKQLAEQIKGKRPTTKEVLGEQVQNVSEQAMYELMGQVIGAGVAKTLGAILPEPREGAVAAQKALKAKGGSLSASQYYDSPTLQLGESFARAGAGGKGQFIALEKRNADAIDAIKNNLIASISKDPVNDRVAGKLFQSAIEKGDDLHKIASSAMYKQFDEAIKPYLEKQLVKETVPSAIVSESGKPFTKEVTKEITKEVSPVPVQLTKSKAFVSEVMEKYIRVDSTPKGKLKEVLDLVRKAPDQMNFSDAQFIRSQLDAIKRDLEKAIEPDSRALGAAKSLVTRITDDMDIGASKLDHEIFKQYREISQFYKTGQKAFANDVITTMMREKPERVGEYLFKSGNVSEITQAKASLRYAHQFDPTIDPKRLYDRLQAGYLNQLLTSKAAVNVEGEVTAKNLMKELANAKTDRQFAVMFTPRERAQIAEFGRTAYLTLMNKPSQFGVLAPILQAGAVGDLLISGARIGTDVALLGAPYGLGKLLSNADATKILIDAMKKPEVMLTGPVVAKLTAEMNKAMEKE